MSTSEPTFSWGKTFVIGFGFLGISVVWALYNAFVPIFLKDSFTMSSLLIGGLMTFNNLLTTVLLPYLGAMSDRTRTKMGRRKPYILIGTPVSALLFVLIPVASQSGSLALMVVALIAWNIVMAMYRSPVVALMPDVTPSQFRSQANGVINLMGGLGTLLAFFGGKKLYEQGVSVPFIAAAVISVLASGAVIAFVREPAIAEPSEVGKSGGGAFQELRANLSDVFSGERSLFYILLANLVWTIGFSAIMTFLTSYTKFHLKLPETTGAMLLGMVALAFMAAAIGAGYIGTTFGRRRTIQFGLAMMALVVAGVLFSARIEVLTGLFIVAGFSWALVIVNALPMVIDMAPADNVGGYTGLYYFASQAGTIIAPTAAGALIDGLGYGSLMAFSSAAFAAGAVCMFRVKRGEASA